MGRVSHIVSNNKKGGLKDDNDNETGYPWDRFLVSEVNNDYYYAVSVGKNPYGFGIYADVKSSKRKQKVLWEAHTNCVTHMVRLVDIWNTISINKNRTKFLNHSRLQ
jgi:hypothetical protein